MKKPIVAVLAVMTLGIAAPDHAQAKPGGCLKYGLGGAIAGHFAGGHRLKGAAAGCALGYIQRRRHESAQRDRLRDRDRGYADRDRGRYDPEGTGSVRRRAPGTDY